MQKQQCPHCHLVQYEAEMCRRCRLAMPPLPVRIVVQRVEIEVPVRVDFFGPSTAVLTLREIEEIAIVDALRKSQNVTEAAQRLGIGKTTLYRKLHEYGLLRRIEGALTKVDVAGHVVEINPSGRAEQFYLQMPGGAR